MTKSTPKATSLADIADACGVTKATVSRVLNAKPGFSVRQELHDKIHQAATSLNYRPNGIARSLRSSKTPIVIILGFHAHWAGSLYGDMLVPISKALKKIGTACFVDLATDDDSSPQWSSLVPDGAIVIPPLTQLRYDKLTRDRIPFVLANEKGIQDVSSVHTNDYVGTKAAIDHLYDLGHRRIAFFNQSHLANGVEYHSSLSVRMNSYAEILDSYGLRPIPGYNQHIPASQYFKQVICQHKPTAVLCYKSSQMHEIHELCQSQGIIVPRDISLIGFDEVKPLNIAGLEYTYLNLPIEDVGSHAARIISKKLENPTYHEVKELDENLVIQQSTAKVPAS